MRSLTLQKVRVDINRQFKQKRQLYEVDQNSGDEKLTATLTKVVYLSNLASHIAFSYQAC